MCFLRLCLPYFIPCIMFTTCSFISCFDLPVLHRMGSDWNQVMSQYGSFLSQIDEQPIGTQHSEFPVDGQPEGSRTPAVTKKPTQRTKLANFTAEEDTRVCHAWLAVSCDPIINTGQKRQGFWSRITEAYNSRRGTLPERSTKSLMSRWGLGLSLPQAKHQLYSLLFNIDLSIFLRLPFIILFFCKKIGYFLKN